ncbi:uncharacterized protein LOC142979827 [Anticarsia gemmatalis]|uniref:uncharacterized protein LOC142979827 n=1 Tax=Anticarsia gemmatalis TaxID=129554 RepID=UPI003F76EA64
MMCEDQDPLHYLPRERWSELQSAFKSDWPRGVAGFTALDTQSRWVEPRIDYDFKVYCPFGDVTNGMVALNVKDQFYEVIIQCPSDNTDKLRKALTKTKLIDWNQTVVVPYAPRNVIDCLQSAVKDIDVELTVHRLLETYVREELFEDVSLPPSLTFGPVTMEHLDLVDSTWPNRYPNSPWHFELLIKTNSGFGLFHNNTLICWVFFKEVGPLQHLYTLEEHRKKGYAELLMKLASNIWMKEGKQVISFCFKDNVNACKLYEKLGFFKSDPVAWCYLNEKENK